MICIEIMFCRKFQLVLLVKIAKEAHGTHKVAIMSHAKHCYQRQPSSNDSIE
ncbi:hypothetical protein Ngar_c27260 [Candidatus Nitrososphaera gargensis Ga9.2]|uniref:Uncharacterized protein n=1 Tax=Nitrososphaera gargensis (strain Ga9.2) TaxID=1237085 RepID=K0ILS6_NITGG|nr:hypothetical protein Ngar_c27260 [Candidatus Nitrososphaera gargensis Ga9.2]